MLCTPVYSLEGMHAVRVPVQQFLEFVVEAKLESYTDDAQTEVRDHSDGAELKQAGQAHHQAREQHSSLSDIPPVNKIHKS